MTVSLGVTVGITLIVRPRLHAIGLIVTLATALAPAGAVAKPPEPQPPVDLSVDSVEVTQAIQTPKNAIRLVARKSTAVRAYIGVDAPAPVSGVTGRLHVFVNGGEVTPAGGVPPIRTITTWGSADRNKDNDTLNFELPAPTAIAPSTDVDFRVDVTPKSGEKNKANNSGAANNLTAVERRTPFIYFTKIDYVPSGLGPPPDGKIAPGTGDAFVRGILPVDDSDPLLYRETTPLAFNIDNGNGVLSGTELYKGSNEQSILLGTLEKQRQLIVSNNAGASDRVFLFGWIAGNPIDGNGAHGARVAFGNTQDDRYQRTFAHELVHAFGRHHNDVEGINDGLDEVGWDVGARLVGNPAGNNETTRAKPITVPLSGPDFDVMTAGKLTNEAWINTVNYNYLLDHCTLVGFCPSFELSPQKKVAIVSGSFDADAAKPVTLDPVFRFPWKSQPSQNLEGRFVAELTDTKGVTTTRRFDFLTGRDSNDDQKVGGAFSVMVPVDPNAEIADLQIKSVNRTVRFAEMKRSKPPRIRINSPGPGAVLGRDERARHERQRDDREGETTEVRWTIDDPDTPDNLVRVEVAYSYDEGRSWVPIGVDIPGTDRALTFDSSEAPDSDGEGVVRVFVSDGLNTAYDDVTGLTLR